jgi:hypothetical protein
MLASKGQPRCGLRRSQKYSLVHHITDCRASFQSVERLTPRQKSTSSQQETPRLSSEGTGDTRRDHQERDGPYSMPNGWFPFQSGMESTWRSVFVGRRFTRNLSEIPTV